MDEEWLRFVETHDPALRDQLVLHYAPLVKFVVGRLGARLPSHVEQQDLVSEGIIGLIDAIERFEPERGVQFQTYAVPRIHGAIMDSIRALDWLPRRVRGQIKRLDEVRALLESANGAAPTTAELAAALGVPPQHIEELETTRAAARMRSLEEIEYGEELEALGTGEEDVEMGEEMIGAVRRLPERDQIVIALYYFEQFSLAEIGTVLGVTESRVSQLRTRALRSLRELV